jgi:hypothetical protein
MVASDRVGRRSFFDVLQPLLEQSDDMVVVEGVEDQLTGAAGPNESHAAEETKLVRHCGFTQSQQLRDVAHAEFGSRDGVQDADARRVAEHSKGLGQRADGLVVEEVLPQLMNI